MLDEYILKVYRRFLKLKEGIYDKNDIHFNYEVGIDNFLIAAASPNYKRMAEIITKKCSDILNELLTNRKNILFHLKRYTDFEVIERDLIIIDDIDGNPIKIPDYSLIENEIIVDEEMQKNFYTKHIFPELFAYKKCFELLQHNFPELIIPISKKKAEAIATIQPGDKGVFIKYGDSRDKFIELLSNPYLTEYEINNYRIEIDVTAGIAAFIFEELVEEKILNISPKLFDKLGCFYNKKTKLTAIRLKSDRSKFDTGLRKGNKKYLEAYKDIIEAFDYIKNIKD